MAACFVRVNTVTFYCEASGLMTRLSPRVNFRVGFELRFCEDFPATIHQVGGSFALGAVPDVVSVLPCDAFAVSVLPGDLQVRPNDPGSRAHSWQEDLAQRSEAVQHLPDKLDDDQTR